MVAMITKLRIENFRCIRTLEMELTPLTVLVGPNASGKSTVLDALTLGRIPREDVRDGTRDGSIRAENRDGEVDQCTVSTPRRWVARIHQFELPAMRQANEVRDAPILARDGANLANAFASLPRRTQTQVAERLTTLVDAFADVDVRPQHRGTHRLVFQDRWDPQRWFEPAQVSDGTMLVLAFLVLQHRQRTSPIVCIEEPERGLHPYLIGRVIHLLREITQGEHGAATQMVLATQSAELLDHVRPEEVRFLERDDDGGVAVSTAPTDDHAWTNAIAEYENSIGQMWLSGSLGGVPGS